MGCDIHLFREKLVEGHWMPFYPDGSDECGFHELDIGRNYKLFGLLAGVRNPCGYSLAPRDAPEDCSSEVWSHIENWSCDGHNHSWLYLHELVGFASFIQNQVNAGKTEFKSALEEMIKIAGSFNLKSATNFHNYRVVFFFDN